jgi:hypothetical protein
MKKNTINNVKSRIESDKGFSVFEHFGYPPRRKNYHSPFRENDKRPSLSVHPNGFFRDHGGDEFKGDAIEFVIRYRKVEYIDALRIIAGIYGLPVDDGKQPTMAPPPPPKPRREKRQVHLPEEILKATMKGYEQNTLIQNLIHSIRYRLPVADVEKVVSMYYLGTVTKGKYQGACTFPYISHGGKVRSIQVKKYDDSCSTVDQTWIHSILKYHYGNNAPAWLTAYLAPDNPKVSTLFGEHLLSRYPRNPVAVCEGQKGAIFGALWCGLPDHAENFLWLATFNKSLNPDLFTVLSGRRVVLFPDLSPDGSLYNEWAQKAKEIVWQVPGVAVSVSSFLERMATEEEKAAKLDLADFLIKQDWRKIRMHTDATVDGMPYLGCRWNGRWQLFECPDGYPESWENHQTRWAREKHPAMAAAIDRMGLEVESIELMTDEEVEMWRKKDTPQVTP